MAVKIKAKVVGLEVVRRKMEKYGADGKKAVRAGIYKVANDIMLNSLLMTPLDQGWLRNTWYATKPKLGVKFSELGYGADYAHHVHEMPSTTNWSEPGTGNKFLEKPFMKRRTKIAKEVAAYARRQLATGGPVTMPQSTIPTKPKTGEGNQQ